MILSVSRKTDIPAFYSKWFFERVEEGFCYVQNPHNAKQISKVLITPELVDGIVFWTKNPKPMLANLQKIKHFSFYFQFSLNSYAQDMEKNLPKKKDLVVTFQRLSDLTSPHHLIWRYDPILLNDTYSVDYHIKYFELLAKQLQNYTHKVVFSFINFYDKISANCLKLGIRTIALQEKEVLAKGLSEIATHYKLSLESCSEDIDLETYGIKHAHCIDSAQFEKISGKEFFVGKDKGQRQACGCVQSVDIGMYNSCNHACQYCYATYSQQSVLENMKKHDAYYPLLLGKVADTIEIKQKEQKSLMRTKQGSLL